MSNIKINNSDYIRFYLISDDKPALLVNNVIGWDEYGLDAARNSDFHGTLTKVSKTLSFTKDTKDFILNEYKEKGILIPAAIIFSSIIAK